MSYFLESERLYFRDIREQDINENYYAWMNDSDREQNMILYELYWRDGTGNEYFVGTLPERRRDPDRITEESILNWGKDFIGDGSDPKSIYFVRVKT